MEGIDAVLSTDICRHLTRRVEFIYKARKHAKYMEMDAARISRQFLSTIRTTAASSAEGPPRGQSWPCTGGLHLVEGGPTPYSRDRQRREALQVTGQGGRVCGLLP